MSNVLEKFESLKNYLRELGSDFQAALIQLFC